MKTQKTIATFLAVGLVLVAMGGAHEAAGALVTSQASSAPTTNVLISQTGKAHSTPWRTQSGLRQAGQTFSVTADTVLEAITVNINSIQNGDLDGDSFTLKVNRYGSTTDYTPDATLLTETGTLPGSMKSSFDGGNTYLTFDITDTSLSAGQQYGFFLDPTGFSNSSNFLLESQGNSSFTAGIGVQHGPAELQIWDGGYQPADMEFYLQGTAGPTPPPPSTLKHHYTFDTDASDSAGSTDGTFVGDAGVSTGGPVGGGYLDLDGNGDWVSFGSNILTPTGSTVSNEVTISGWVRFDGATKVNPSDTRNLGTFYSESSGGSARYNFDGRADQNNGQMSLDQFPPSGGNFGASNTGFTDFDWHHVAYVQSADSPRRQFFVDGMQFATSGTPENYTGGTSFDVAIGNRTGVNGKEPDAGLDDMAFWHEALSTGEMKGLYDLALDPTLGYNAGQFDLLKRVHDGVLDSTTIGTLEWARATGLTGGAGLSGSGSAFTLVLDGAARTGLTSAPAGAPIPEPATMCALGLALAGLGGYVRKRKRA